MEKVNVSEFLKHKSLELEDPAESEAVVEAVLEHAGSERKH